jgi:GlpG protein
MRQIATISAETHARTFADYLLTRGIPTRIVQSGPDWQVWALNEDQVQAARDEFEAFQRTPDDPRYHNLGSQVRSIRKKAERVERRHQEESYDVRYIWTSRDLRRCPLTWTLLVLSVFITLVTSFGRDPRLMRLLYVARYEIVSPERFEPDNDEHLYVIRDSQVFRTNLRADLARGEIWRLITPIFLHFNWPHLLFDMYLLFALGSEVEVRRRSWRLAVIVLTAAVVSNLIQYLLTHDPRFGGMSGVDMALFGFIWMKGLYEPEMGLSLSRQTVLVILAYIAYAYLFRSDFPYSSHLTGLVVGMLFALAPLTWASLRGPRDDE